MSITRPSRNLGLIMALNEMIIQPKVIASRVYLVVGQFATTMSMLATIGIDYVKTAMGQRLGLMTDVMRTINRARTSEMAGWIAGTITSYWSSLVCSKSEAALP
jgi:hypothetical protein